MKSNFDHLRMPWNSFDPFAFDQLLTEVENGLAELAYLDAASAYLVDLHTPAAGPGPANHTLEVSLGWTHPFIRRVTTPNAHSPGFADHVTQHLRELFETEQQWSSANIDTIRDQTKLIRRASTDPLDEVVRELHDVYSTINMFISENFAHLDRNAGDWRGPAAETFFNDFYGKFAQIKDNQLELVLGLIAAVSSSRLVLRTAQASLVSILTAARDLITEQLEKRSMNDDGPSTKTVLMVGAAAAAVFGSTAVPALWAIGLSMTSQAMALAAGTIPEDATTEGETISAASARELLDGLTDKVSMTMRRTESEYEVLGDAVRDMWGEIDDLHRSKLLIPPAPIAGSEVEAKSFHHVSSSYY